MQLDKECKAFFIKPSNVTQEVETVVLANGENGRVIGRDASTNHYKLEFRPDAWHR